LAIVSGIRPGSVWNFEHTRLQVLAARGCWKSGTSRGSAVRCRWCANPSCATASILTALLIPGVTTSAAHAWH